MAFAPRQASGRSRLQDCPLSSRERRQSERLLFAAMMNPFGPILMFELRRMARRGRGFVLRSVYGFAVLLAMYFTFEATVKRPALSAYQAYPDVSRFAEQFFEMFLLLQFVTVVLVT